jgi:hypothetical protein
MPTREVISMNIIYLDYAGSPQTMIDEEMHYLFKYFTERIHHLTRIITRCQQEGKKRRNSLK